MRRRPILTLAAAVVMLLLAGVAIDIGASSPVLCGSCHEMASGTHSWSHSAHSTVPCVDCHLPAREWYAVPRRVADRVALLERDFSAHFYGAYAASNSATGVADVTVGDEACLQCHDANRKATSGFRILIDHAEHAERNGSCVSCHVGTAHPTETRGRAMSLMTQCFTCHGLDASAKAPGECGVCHPSGYKLLPESHKGGGWRRGHAQVLSADPDQCSMCHRQAFCDNCHGLEIPHPSKWSQEHQRAAVSAKPQVCAQCHEGGAEVCSTCHHSSFDPKRGPWVRQHFEQVRTDGMGECLDCHSPAFCSGCHVRGAG